MVEITFSMRVYVCVRSSLVYIEWVYLRVCVCMRTVLS